MKKLLVVLLLLVAIAVSATLVGVWLSGSGSTLALGGPRVLTLTLDERVPDYAPPAVLPWLRMRPAPSIASLYRALSKARQDDSIRGLAIYIEDARFGLAKAQELRQLLASLRDSGKFVECYLETAGEGSNGTLDYYFATACDRITLAPAGELNLIGFYAASRFLRGSLDKLKVEPEMASVGRYKSANETYTEYRHSPAAEEALSDVLDALFGQVVGDIARSRGLSPGEVQELIDGAPYSAEEALSLGLVDALGYRDEFDTELRQRVGKKPSLVRLGDYAPLHSAGRGRRVAVVFAQGTILRGGSGLDPWTDTLFLGSDDLGKLLQDLAKNDRVEAVVLRIDSPGGSALASDLILRRVTKLVEVKPVVVSMSDLAASGGYYIASRASRIVAEPATLTGSIGVVGGKLVTRRFQEDLLGITHDTLQRGLNADIYSSLTRFTPLQRKRYESLMSGVYERFLDHVAAGRGLDRTAVEAVAEGRVWTGERALALGLVDALGGLDEALQQVREAIGAGGETPLALDYYPKPASLLEALAASRSLPLPVALRWVALGSSAAPGRLRALAALSDRRPELLELPAAYRVLVSAF